MNKYSDIEIQTAKNLLKEGYKWIARTFQGNVGAFSCKPCKRGGWWFYPSNLACITGKTVIVSGKFAPLFQSIKWADNEPTYIEDIIKSQVLDDAERKGEPMDLIERQKAIDALMAWEEGSVWDDECLKHRGEPFWVAPSDVIERLHSAQPEQRWIPCSDENPKADGRYLITGKMGTVYSLDFEDGRWYGGIKPVAWMPLPEPYREERTEE